MILTCMAFVIVVAAIGVWCVAQDLRWSLPVGRLLVAVAIALILSTTLYAAEVALLGCNDYEKYSLLWYANGCFLWEHSS